MNIDRTTLLFFDASCLIAASGSPAGGSSFLLSLCVRHFLQGIVSQFVLLEAERNIDAKIGRDALETFHNLLILTPLTLASVPAHLVQFAVSHGVNQKDAPVVASALSMSASYLLTLDRGLLAEVNQADVSLEAFTPGDFIKSVLPSHVDFPGLRD